MWLCSSKVIERLRTTSTSTTASAQRLHRLGERELLADQSGDEAPAADLAARLERAERAQDDAPRRHARLARDELAHDHTPAAEKLAREAHRLGLGPRVGAGAQERPAARRHESRPPAAPRAH